MSRQLPKSALPVLISIAFLGLVLMAMQLASRALPVRASIASVHPHSDASNQDCPAPTTEPPPPTLETEWHDTCVTHRLQIAGAGLGDAITSVNPRTLDMASPEQTTWLLAQVAGRTTSSNETPERVVFTSDTQSIAVDSPTKATETGYTFETNLQPSGQITAWVNNTGSDFKTPRGLVVYAKQDTANERWTSVGKTMNEYVYRNYGTGSHAEVLSFEALTGTRDLSITAVVIDNNEDDRPMVVEAMAGSVTASRAFTGPTEGALLNIVSLTLPQVPTGTDQVTVMLHSPAENGDSLVWVGVNVGYRCGVGNDADDDSKRTGIYLPIVLKDHCVPFIDKFDSPSSNWPIIENSDLLTEYVNDEYRMVTKNKGLHYAYNQSFPDYYTNFEIEVDARWANSSSTGKGYGIIFGLANDDSHAYIFQINSDRQQYRLLLFKNGTWWYYANNAWHRPTQVEKGWINTASISSGTNTNRLKIIHNDSEIKMFVNNQHLNTATDDTISSGRVGLNVERYDADPIFSTRNADVRFDNYSFDLCSTVEIIGSLGDFSISDESTGTLPSTD